MRMSRNALYNKHLDLWSDELAVEKAEKKLKRTQAELEALKVVAMFQS